MPSSKRSFVTFCHLRSFILSAFCLQAGKATGFGYSSVSAVLLTELPLSSATAKPGWCGTYLSQLIGKPGCTQRYLRKNMFIAPDPAFTSCLWSRLYTYMWIQIHGRRDKKRQSVLGDLCVCACVGWGCAFRRLRYGGEKSYRQK